MRRRTDLWSESVHAPRTSRPRGYDLDLRASEDAANLKRLFGASPEPVIVAIAPRESLTAVAGRMTEPRFVTVLRRLPAAFAKAPTAARRPVALRANSGRA
jgi:hypothetical protein